MRLLVIGALMASGAAWGQDCPTSPVLTLSGVDGEALPANAILRGRYVHTLPSGLEIIDERTDGPVAFIVDDAPPSDGFGGRGWVGLRASDGAWPGGSSLVVRGDAGTIARFSVLDWSDTDPPDPPEVSEAFVVEREVEGGLEREFILPLERSASEPVTYEVRFAEKTGAFAGIPLRVSGDDQLVFRDGPCGGEAVAHFDPTMFYVEVVAVDHSGNTSRPTVVQPASTGKRGCATGSGAGFMAWWAVLGMRRRSRG